MVREQQELLRRTLPVTRDRWLRQVYEQAVSRPMTSEEVDAIRDNVLARGLGGQ